ncbi:MAG: C10 family peptidase, partial [Bacteroidales bacterium]|nr:C10 family peptidase [Bacteroidales bacterium]
MKTRLVSIILVFSALMGGKANADNVDLQTAKQIGAYYFNVATGTKAPVNADKLVLVQQFDNPTLCIPALYAFNVADNGFVVVSASNTVQPVLAYSPEGSLENINPTCRYILESYARLISQDQIHNAAPTAEVNVMWNELIDQTFTCDLSSKAVLVKAKWGQGDPERPSYNIFCPQVNGQPCLTGCVATAMAMIIHYWKYPVKGGNDNTTTASTSWHNQMIKYKFGVDSNKFVFDSMPNQIAYSSPWNNKRAVGKLSFACGVTVKMDWGIDGSGAFSQDVPKAFWNWFKYSDQATYLLRSGVSSDAQWLNILHNEIDSNSRPVYYSASDPDPTHGSDAAGHAFVIAGSSASSNSM